QFAKALLEELLPEMASLGSEVTKCASLLAEAAKTFDERIAERCADTGRADLRQQLVRYYNPDSVKAFARSLVKDRQEQLKQTTEARQALLELLGESATFAGVSQRVSKQRLLDVLESRCERSAVDAHNALVAGSKDASRILGTSIIESLQKEF